MDELVVIGIVMDSLFLKSKSPLNQEYLLLRDSPKFISQKKYCEDLWNEFQRYADPDFPQQFSQDINSRFWEMYLGAFILNQGFNLLSKNNAIGPDIQFIHKGRKNVIEAVTPGEGSGVDAVPGIFEHDRFEPVTEEKIILRFTNVISEKLKKFQYYIRSGLVGSDDILIIAVNGGKIDLLMTDEPIPYIIKSVFLIGDYVVKINRLSRSIKSEGYRERVAIVKESGSRVETNSFFNPDFSIISGILFSSVRLIEMPSLQT